MMAAVQSEVPPLCVCRRKIAQIFCQKGLLLAAECGIISFVDWVWRSLVACLNGVQEAGSSNLLTQTFSLRCDDVSEAVFCLYLGINRPSAVADASAWRGLIFIFVRFVSA